MRNLKRVLALAMAMVMILGMMVIGSSAASYSDAAAIDADYAEAVEVLSGMGVFKGTGAGFAPKQILTRAEAAALIYRVITGDVEDAQKGNYDYASLKDVKAGEWYTGYVTYANNGGYIKGDDAGNFNPYQQVTGIQVMAIMLRAAGYGQNGEYEGAAWKDNILTDALELGITGDIAIATLDAPASRELVAQLLLNAITSVDMVTYTPALGYLAVNFTSDGWRGSKTLGEKVFDLKKVSGTIAMAATDVVLDDADDKTNNLTLDDGYAFEVGRKAYVWTTNQSKKAPIVAGVYYTGKLLATVYDDAYATGWTKGATKTTPAAKNYVADEDTAVTLVINGVNYGTKTTAQIDVALEKGAEVRLFDQDKNGKIDLVIALQEDVKVVGTKGVKVVTGKNDKDYVTVDGIASIDGVLANTVVGYEDVTAGDVVLYVKMPTEIEYLTVAESVEGQMTKRNIVTKTIVFGGEEYGESGLTDHDVKELFYSGNTNANKDYTLWLDRGGYAIWDKEVKDPTTYAVVLDTYFVHTTNKDVTYYAELLYVDATTEIVEAADYYDEFEGGWVTYSVVKGEYVLKNANTAIAGEIEIDGKTAALGDDRATEDTIYLVQSGTKGNYTYDAYVGFENVPAMTANGLDIVDSGKNTTLGKDIASHVYVASSDVYTLKDIVIYTLNETKIITYKDAKGNNWYEIPVLVDGADDVLLMSEAQFIASFLDADQKETQATGVIGYYEDVAVDNASGQLKAAALLAADATYTSKVADIDYAVKTIEIDGTVWNAGAATIYEIANDKYTTVELSDVVLGDNVVYFTEGKYITEMYVLPEHKAPAAVNTLTVTGHGVTESVTTLVGDVSAVTLVVDLDDYVKAGYEITGYNVVGTNTYTYDQATKVVSLTNVKDSVVITIATEATVYDITYVLDGGVNAAGNPTTYTADALPVVAAATKTGYSFAGWTITDTATGLAATAADLVDLTYTAEWDALTFDVEFKYYDAAGKEIVSESQTVEATAGTPKDVRLGTNENYVYVVDKTYTVDDYYTIKGVTEDLIGDKAIKVTVCPKLGKDSLTNGIDNVAEFLAMAEEMPILAKNSVTTYELKVDIDLTGITWNPINLWAPEKSVTITIDGNNHTITGLTVSGGEKVGFIGSNTTTLTIKDLAFDSAEVSGTGNFIGTVIGYNYGDVTLENVAVVNSVIESTSTSGGSVGGLIGFDAPDGKGADLTECSATDNKIIATYQQGGLCGRYLAGGTTTDCTSEDNTFYASAAKWVADIAWTGVTDGASSANTMVIG